MSYQVESGSGADSTARGEGCPVEMQPGYFCGRAIHAAEGVDERPVCLMHSKDPAKLSGGLREDFWREIEGKLEAAGDRGWVDFRYFCFPKVDFRKRTIRPLCRFDHAKFAEDVDFSDGAFLSEANFEEATFAEDANFANAVFKDGSRFGRTTFADDVSFLGAEFVWRAQFTGAKFAGYASFNHTIFSSAAEFGSAAFGQEADFFCARFRDDARFFDTSFSGEAQFSHAEFHGKTTFGLSAFSGAVYMGNATFSDRAEFGSATFAQRAWFEEARFLGGVYLAGSRFLESASFNGTVFDPTKRNIPGALFGGTWFCKPREIVFENADLSLVSFRGCDVSELRFDSSVRWGRKGQRRAVILEETVDLTDHWAEGLKRDGRRDFAAVAQIYQQLKKNYDARLDYWTADEFHFGEMEMRRLASSYPWLNIAAWYRYVSDYGNNYVKPLWWLLGLLAGAALAFPMPGLGLQKYRACVETYVNVWPSAGSWWQRIGCEGVLVMKSWLMAVDVAMFQKGANYSPASEGAHAVAVLEALSTSTVFGLFLLAVRRQFRR